MKSINTAIAGSEVKSATETTTKSTLETGTAKDIETAAEVREAIIGEKGLTQQIDSIKSESMEAVAARNEAKLSEHIQANREAGKERETVVRSELERKYPDDIIQSQSILRDSNGKVVKDSQTGEARRIDFTAIKDGEVVKSVEVTSLTADKTAQEAKEARIREAGGNFIKDRTTGELVPIASGVKTEIVRRA